MLKEALTAINASLGAELDHPAFSKVGKVTVSKDQAKVWASAFALDEPSGQERTAIGESLTGEGAQVQLRNTLATIKSIIEHQNGQMGLDEIRARMCHDFSQLAYIAKHEPVPSLWRLMQPGSCSGWLLKHYCSGF
jgi:hypothetical protein